MRFQLSTCVCSACILTLFAAYSSSDAHGESKPISSMKAPACRFVEATQQRIEADRARNLSGFGEARSSQTPKADLWGRTRRSIPERQAVLPQTRGLDVRASYANLFAEQKSLLRTLVENCAGNSIVGPDAESVYGDLDGSQRGTFLAVTHALLHSRLEDRDGNDLGRAIDLVAEMTDIHGEDFYAPSDEQFQFYVTLTPDAITKLERAAAFEYGVNHGGFPFSFRQYRREGLYGREAGVHISVAPDRRHAVIHVDYLYGVIHLFPMNSDVRAIGNLKMHLERWPGFALSDNPSERATSTIPAAQRTRSDYSYPAL